MTEKWGIWNSIKKEFQFGISEDTPEKARKRLFQKIGKDAYKWRFEVKRMKGERKEDGSHEQRGEKAQKGTGAGAPEA